MSTPLEIEIGITSNESDFAWKVGTKSTFLSLMLRVPTRTGKPGKPGKMGRHFPVREKSGNFEQTGKVREKSGKIIQNTGKLR